MMHSTATARSASGAATRADAGAADEPDGELRRAVLLTLTYSDLFDYPLSADELYRDLVAACPRRADFDRALEGLTDTRAVLRIGDRFCLAGRETLPELRAGRERVATARWRQARRFARWLAWVPFVRMVAVCGSQAVDNPTPDGDVDLFLITAPDRLWLAQAPTMVLRRLAKPLLGADFCPNYLLAEDALAVEPHNLYTAHEVAQVVPLWGEPTFARFCDANRWTARFLPQRSLEARGGRLEPRPRNRLARAIERLLGGRAGDALDRLVHRLLVAYYARRLGRPRSEVARAYRHDRQVVVTGGYLGAVAERFAERVREVLGDDDAHRAREVFQPPGGAPRDDPSADPLYGELFARRYGGGGA